MEKLKNKRLFKNTRKYIGGLNGNSPYFTYSILIPELNIMEVDRSIYLPNLLTGQSFNLVKLLQAIIKKDAVLQEFYLCYGNELDGLLKENTYIWDFPLLIFRSTDMLGYLCYIIIKL